MPKLSAGILLYRWQDVAQAPEVLLVHPGGPFWAKKDAAAWSVPKGEYTDGEDAWAGAQREFTEETGFAPPEGERLALGDVKYGNKVLTVWAMMGNIDARQVRSNSFEMQWPPKSGQTQQFPEVDRADWFTPAVARQKLVKGQAELIDRLCEQLGIPPDDAEPAAQMSLL